MKLHDGQTPGTPADYRCTRRSFLLYSLLGILGLEIGGCEQSGGVQDAWLDEVSPYPEEAANIGREYLAIHPEERNHEFLVRKVKDALLVSPGRESSEINAVNKVDYTFAGLEHAIRNEYARGDMVIIHGWAISPTEARLYALFSLR